MITDLLKNKGYSFSFHTNVPVYVAGKQGETVNMPVDVAIMPFSAKNGDMPLLLAARITNRCRKNW